MIKKLYAILIISTLFISTPMLAMLQKYLPPTSQDLKSSLKSYNFNTMLEEKKIELNKKKKDMLYCGGVAALSISTFAISAYIARGFVLNREVGNGLIENGFLKLAKAPGSVFRYFNLFPGFCFGQYRETIFWSALSGVSFYKANKNLIKYSSLKYFTLPKEEEQIKILETKMKDL